MGKYRLIMVLTFGQVLGISGDLRTVLAQGSLCRPCYIVSATAHYPAGGWPA